MSLTKPDLRKRIRQHRQTMSMEQIAKKSRDLCEMVCATQLYRDARTVYGYLPFRQEVDLRPLLERAMAEGKAVALPKCSGQQMCFIRMKDLTLVQFGAFGAPEPVADAPVDQDAEALVILPGLAFDHQGFRVGYGGGFYDRYLADHPHHPTIGLCFDFQLLEALPRDAHDIPADMVFWT